MQQSEIDLNQLRRKVEAEFLRYAETYVPPPPGETVGVSWSKEKVKTEVEGMVNLIVDPYLVKYLVRRRPVTVGTAFDWRTSCFRGGRR